MTNRMDNENNIQNLASLEDDLVVLNDVVELSSQYSDVEVSDKQMTLIDENNLIQSYELLMMENSILQEKIKTMNQKLVQRIDEMKKMKSMQVKWREINKANHQRAKEEILRLRDENKAYKQRIDKMLEELGQIMQREMDPEYKRQLEHISLQMKGVQQETKEEGFEKCEVEQTEVNDSEPTEMKEMCEQTVADGQFTKSNMENRIEQLDMIVMQLSEMIKIEKQKMVEVSNELAEAVNETSVECNKVKSINTQLNENLTSLQNLHTKIQSEIEALKADATNYQQMQEEKSRETALHLIVLFKAERQKCTSLQEKLAKESKRVQELEVDLVMAQEKLETKDSKLDKELSERKIEHKMPVQELSSKLDELSQKLENAQEPAYQSTGENMCKLKSQVMALMAGLEEMNKEVDNASMQIQKRSERIKNLELKNAVIASEQYSKSMQYTAIIERLQQVIEQLGEKLKGYEEVIEKKNELFMKCQVLQGLYQEVCHKYEEIKHKAADEKEPQYQSGENMQELRSQVMTLQEELEEKNKQFEDANVQIEKGNERIESLEVKNAVIASEQYNQSMQYTAIIERLQQEIEQLGEKLKGYEEVVKHLQQEIEQLGEKLQGYEEVVEERNDLLMKCQQLQDVCCKCEEIKHKVVDEKEFEELFFKLSNC